MIQNVSRSRIKPQISKIITKTVKNAINDSERIYQPFIHSALYKRNKNRLKCIFTVMSTIWYCIIWSHIETFGRIRIAFNCFDCLGYVPTDCMIRFLRVFKSYFQSTLNSLSKCFIQSELRMLKSIDSLFWKYTFLISFDVTD